MILRRLVSGFVAAALATAAAHPCAVAQTTSPSASPGHDRQQPPRSTPGEGAELPPVSLDRIRRALAHEPAIRLPEPQGPVFSVNIEARLPAFADFLGEESLSRGPAPSTSLAHREFLAMVAPPQTQSFGAFTPGELVQVAATSAAIGLGSQWLIQGIKDAIRDKREREARREVQAVLAELERRQKEKEKEKE